MEYKKFWAKLNKWLDQHERLSMNDMNDIKGRQELFEMAAEQMTPQILRGPFITTIFYSNILNGWINGLNG